MDYFGVCAYQAITFSSRHGTFSDLRPKTIAPPSDLDRHSSHFGGGSPPPTYSSSGMLFKHLLSLSPPEILSPFNSGLVTGPFPGFSDFFPVGCRHMSRLHGDVFAGFLSRSNEVAVSSLSTVFRNCLVSRTVGAVVSLGLNIPQYARLTSPDPKRFE